LFTGAVATLYHSEDMIDFISNYLDSPNDKLLSVLADIKCSDVLSHVSAIALASMIFAEPFWNVINSDVCSRFQMITQLPFNNSQHG
jgi:hypothetical protein